MWSGKSKNISSIINLILFVCCVTHVSILLEQEIQPEFTDSKVYQRKLQEIEFPLVFKLCLSSGVYFEEHYKRYGYENQYGFYQGISLYNSSFVGWNGHTENGSTMGQVQDIVGNLSMDWNDFIEEIELYTITKEMFIFSGPNLTWNSFDLFGSCQYIDLFDYVDMAQNTPLQFFIKVKSVPRFGISLSIEERNKRIQKRSLKTSLLSYNGPLLVNDNLSQGRRIKLVVKLSETKFPEEDNGQCSKYPNVHFKSYSDCDQAFVKNFTQTNYNMTPFWAADSFDEVTETRYYGNTNFTDLADLVDGTETSNCLPPCLSTTVGHIC